MENQLHLTKEQFEKIGFAFVDQSGIVKYYHIEEKIYYSLTGVDSDHWFYLGDQWDFRKAPFVPLNIQSIDELYMVLKAFGIKFKALI